jgi:phage tail P2-like protein
LQTALPSSLPQIWNADLCPENILEWLAWSLSVDSWSSDWSLAIRREQVKKSIPIHKKKGTVKAVKDVVASFGGGVLLREWWQTTPRGTPHTFVLELALIGENALAPTQSFIDQVIAAVTDAKPARSHFTFQMAAQSVGGIGVLAVARAFSITRISATMQ